MEMHHWFLLGVPKSSGSKLKTMGRDNSLFNTLRQGEFETAGYCSNVAVCTKIKKYIYSLTRLLEIISTGV